MIKGKTIIVTGAARGLGQKYALEFAKAEANIIFADISDCSETEKKVSEVTDKFLSLNLDVTDINSCNKMMAKAVDCLLYTSPSPRDRQKSRMPSSA